MAGDVVHMCPEILPYPGRDPLVGRLGKLGRLAGIDIVQSSIFLAHSYICLDNEPGCHLARI